ncbi:MAG: cobalt transporter [Melioribacteraceae bacterium]|nr:MAG: cobalt transporter [Melioribacteraceae bacterium]
MHNHSHNHTHGSDNLKTAFFLNFVFSILEIAGGILTNSMAILSDALHDFGDSLAIAIAWYLQKKAASGSDEKFSFGYKRFSLLGALINSIILVVGSVFILSESIPRILSPEETHAPGMLIFSLLGITINGIAVLKLKGAKTLNEKVVSWHLIEDVLGWAAVLVVSIVLLFTDFYILDPILSAVITLYVLYNVVKNLKATSYLFLQGVPSEISLKKVENQLGKATGVKSVHHTHIWSLDGENHVMSVHVVVDTKTNAEKVLETKKSVKEIAKSFDINHVTIEIEFENENCYMKPDTA